MIHSPRLHATLLTLAIGGVLASGGCRGARVRSSRQVAPADLCPTLLPGSRWESAPWEGGCPWFEFPEATVLEVPHGLGRAPAAVLVYLSFVPEGSQAVLASGDLARVVSVSADTVTLSNATEQGMYARVVLW